MTSPMTGKFASIRFPKLFLLALLLITFSATARAQVGCGGEGQSVCTVADAESTRTTTMQAANTILTPTEISFQPGWRQLLCHTHRYALTKGMTGQMDWTAWALSDQRNGIGRKNNSTGSRRWAPTTHTATNQGYTRDLGQNQVYSITDQLNVGARILELDPHTYYQPGTGGT